MSIADLKGVLPSAQDVGSPYKVTDTSTTGSDTSASSDSASSDSSSGSDDFTKAAEKQCPDLAKLSKQLDKSNNDPKATVPSPRTRTTPSRWRSTPTATTSAAGT